MIYEEFLESKKKLILPTGKIVSPDTVHKKLFDFQRDIVVWAVKRGRCAVFADTGLGKTFIQIEWARLLGGHSLIVAPLSVARQTIREAKKIGVSVTYAKNDSQLVAGINITNYENIDNIERNDFNSVVLDESSILKSFDGATRKKLCKKFAKTPYRLCCTATPAPNDQTEIGNHAEFLGVCTMPEMLSTYFVNANKTTEYLSDSGHLIRKKHSNKHGTEWRLRYHAMQEYYRWLSSWAMAIRKPSDLGYSDDGYILPPLTVTPIYIDSHFVPEDELFFTGLRGIAHRSSVRKGTIEKKIQEVVRLSSGKDQVIVWCGLDYESKLATKSIPDAVEVTGSDSPESKAKAFEDFQDGKIRVLVTKPKIGGFGMNFQNAHRMIFFGMNDSWETFYQCIRREYRFGQKKAVEVSCILADVEQQIYDNVVSKGNNADRMMNGLIEVMSTYEKMEIGKMETKIQTDYKEETVKGDSFTAMLGDSSVRLKELKDESIDMSVYSPPFADLYTYSATERDLGNSHNWNEFFSHYSFIIKEILRVTKAGRVTCVHSSDIPAMQMKDGYIGIRDFPGAVIRAYEKEGWIFYGRAIVTKNPQAQAIRTKSKALLFASLRKDSADSRPALLDHILIFLKPGENDIPITPVANGEIDNEKWIDWAGGIWTGISESDTLQYTTARDKNDEKHICPLQLGTIERCIKLYSNPGETVLTPFMGIGSEAYQAIRFGRKAIGIELKESYFQIAVDNLKEIERQSTADTLFSVVENIPDSTFMETETID